jgi:hypothetical protein
MNYKERYEKLLEEIGTSFSKAIKAHCFQCSGYDYKEAKLCENKNCALYVLRKNKEVKIKTSE